MKEYMVFGGPLKIRYKGHWDWGGLYRLVWQWLLKRQFRAHERRYKDKTDTVMGNEMEIDVWGEKEVTEYYMYRFDIYYHVWEGKEVPVMVNGQQVKRMRGRMHIEINAKVITDWQKKYSPNNMVQKMMEKFLNDVVLKREIEIKHIDYLDKDLHMLESEIKKFLKMEVDPSSVG